MFPKLLRGHGLQFVVAKFQPERYVPIAQGIHVPVLPLPGGQGQVEGVAQVRIVAALN